jgi:hypothetical protein
MKKSLADIEVSSSVKAPKHVEKRFGAFKTVNDGQAVIDLEILRQHNIFFATPCYGGSLTDQYFLSMIRTLQTFIKHGINFRITTLRNESLISRARNILTAMFLESECTHLLFIDADIEFQPDDVLRALAYDKPIMAGAYPKKTLPIQYALNFKFQNPETRQIRVENGAVELLDASTGFFLIKREVFEKMIEAHPELHYRNDSNIDESLEKHCYALFDTMIDPHDNRYLSEDYTFCRRWQALGGEIWLDPNAKLNHVGSYTFEGDISKIISSK